ncbi:B12-binding domain-containing radical SAM protein [Desulforudis sp. 1088]|uniref:B12-binding domain-containing radical SAM protein n=1 Tax=unclassified Candidatus Desulforudis TaxID=2635950 RepID=UPI003CE57028
MRVLMVYPKYPDTFWSFKYALRFVGKRAAYPPLGLLTVAAMLPAAWDKRLIDLNVARLTDADLRWADYVFLSAMEIQRGSVKEVLARCRSLGVKTVAGGPLFTAEPETFAEVDYLVLNEAEATLPAFLADLEKGCARHIYATGARPDLSLTPVPAWELIDFRDYASMSIQFSRGCPYDCEFCNVTSLFGRKPRLKQKEQLLRELDALYHYGWRGSVFIVDDNFIGNKARMKGEILPALIGWMESRRHPFTFITETSINLADDEELLDLMRKAGFVHVFVGIETPSEESLKECKKFHNLHRDLLAAVRKIQNHGLQVSAGFIVGFDSDTPSIFERQINFIQKSGIVTAMVGLLNAPRGTRLFERLKQEKRLLQNFSGNNTDYSLNFIPKMNPQVLLDGYRRIVTTIYAPEPYYQRIWEFFREFRPARRAGIRHLRLCYLTALFKAMFYLGVLDKGRKHYWQLLIKTLFRRPRFLPEAITFAIYGFHFRRVYSGRG